MTVRLALLAALLAVTFSGCDEKASQKAYDRGVSAGLAEGYRDGKLDGATGSPRRPEDREKKPSWLSRMDPLSLLGSILLGLMLGFVGQYLLFYLLRSRKVIADVDGILLRGAAHRMPAEGPPDPRLPGVVLLLAILPVALSCGSSEDDYRRGYQAGYSQGFASGYAEGIGKRAAGVPVRRVQPRSSTAFQVPAFLIALFLASAFGVALQYSILSDARKKQSLPSLAACAFVPGMRSTFSYRLLSEKTRAMAELDEFLRQVRSRSRGRIAEVEAVRDEVEAKIRAASSLEALFAERTVELAKRELERIVEGK